MANDRKELLNDMGSLLRGFGRTLQSDIWTALPGFVTEWNPAKMVCKVQPTIQGNVTDPDGKSQWVTLPILVDCPMVFPSGGGFCLTFPITLGDEVLVIFASRCIDSWWQSSGVQQQAEFRMHDLSDGFAIPGPRSLKHVVPNILRDGVELRADDGAARITIQQDRTIIVSTTADAKVVAENALVIAHTRAIVEAPSIQLTGNVSIEGTLRVSGDTSMAGSLDVTGNVGAPNFKTPTTSLNTHLHTGVKGGGDTSGPPKVNS